MARYIDADLLLEQLGKKQTEVAKYRYTEGFNHAIMRVRSMISSSATADVVPKSEIEEILNAVDSMIELVSAMIGLDIIAFGGKYAELKKKYTGGNDE